MKKSHLVVLIIFMVIILDQCLKIWVKTHLAYNEGFDIFGLPWAKIHFIENPGMAFGFTFGGEYGKLFLSIFRICMVGFLIYLVRRLIAANESKGLLISFALIIAGAIGNIIDSCFYGMIFSESLHHSREVAQLFPEGGGYAPFLFGKVVDMLYFPIIDTTLPDWIPYYGGEKFKFFRPIFNLADTAISTGVISILLFHRSFFTNKENDSQNTTEEENDKLVTNM